MCCNRVERDGSLIHLLPELGAIHHNTVLTMLEVGDEERSVMKHPPHASTVKSKTWIAFGHLAIEHRHSQATIPMLLRSVSCSHQGPMHQSLLVMALVDFDLGQPLGWLHRRPQTGTSHAQINQPGFRMQFHPHELIIRRPFKSNGITRSEASTPQLSPRAVPFCLISCGQHSSLSSSDQLQHAV